MINYLLPYLIAITMPNKIPQQIPVHKEHLFFEIAEQKPRPKKNRKQRRANKRLQGK